MRVGDIVALSQKPTVQGGPGVFMAPGTVAEVRAIEPDPANPDSNVVLVRQVEGSMAGLIQWVDESSLSVLSDEEADPIRALVADALS